MQSFSGSRARLLIRSRKSGSIAKEKKTPVGTFSASFRVPLANSPFPPSSFLGSVTPQNAPTTDNPPTFSHGRHNFTLTARGTRTRTHLKAYLALIHRKPGTNSGYPRRQAKAMCTTSAFSKSARPAFRQKRSSDAPPERRPVKRVSFSKRDNVLGRAQDYDRTSFEVPLMMRKRRTRTPAPAPQKHMKQTPVAGDDHPHQSQPHQPQHANFNGMWRRSHGFNWASLLLFSGVDEAAIADQVRVGRQRATMAD